MHVRRGCEKPDPNPLRRSPEAAASNVREGWQADLNDPPSLIHRTEALRGVEKLPMATTDQIDRILGRMRTMSAADLSNLEAGLTHPDNTLTTQPGSANDFLWKEMEELGWLQASDGSFDLPNGKSFPLRKYAFTEEGRVPIAALLAKDRGGVRRRPAEVNARMADLSNTLCSEFLQTLRDRVSEAGGNRGDLEILLISTMVRGVKAGRSPDDANRALDNCFELARKILRA